jgi:hypothetical protein
VEGAGDFLVLRQAHLVLHRRRRCHLREPGASDGEGSAGSEARVWDGGMGNSSPKWFGLGGVAEVAEFRSRETAVAKEGGRRRRCGKGAGYGSGAGGEVACGGGSEGGVRGRRMDP